MTARLIINGIEKVYESGAMPATLAELLAAMNVDQATVVAEIDGDIVRDRFDATCLTDGMTLELVRFVPEDNSDRYADYCRQDLSIATAGRHRQVCIPRVDGRGDCRFGTQIVTVALRRVDIENENDNMLAAIDRDKYMLLPNTSGRSGRSRGGELALARAASGIHWVKLEVTPDPYYLLPDGEETLKAAETLVKDGFVVLPYINADPILAKKLQDVGCATVMPLASPIGSNQGLKTRSSIEIIIEQAAVPVVVDAGLGAPSHAAEAMEMGADAVLVNTAIATAEDPVRMAEAFKPP